MAWQDRAYNREDGGGTQVRFGFTPPTRMVLGIIIACIVGFLLRSITHGAFNQYASLTASRTDLYQPWRFITYQYAHSTVSHIFWNLIGIYFFLSPIDRLWGSRRALAFYTAGGIVAGLCFEILALIHPTPGLVGASGSVLAATGACALLFPEMTIYLLVFPVPIRLLAVLLALLYTLSVIAGENLGDAAHLGGLAFGVLAPLYGRPMWHRFILRQHRAKAKHTMLSERAEQEEVDRILQKVHDSGMNSLSRWEKRTLRKATERQRLSETTRGRRGI